MAGFTYGNGIVHATSQTARGLPDVREDAGVYKDKHVWDRHGNVKAIADQRVSPPQSRSFCRPSPPRRPR